MSNRVLVLQDIVKALSQETDTSEALCQSFVKELFAVVAERLMEGESVTLKGVGRFDVDGGEVRFVADQNTAAAINSAFDCFEAIELADDFDGDEPVTEEETPEVAEESETNVDEAAETEDVADGNSADGAEPEESQADVSEDTEDDNVEEKEEDTEDDAANDVVEEQEEAEGDTEEIEEGESYDEPLPKRSGARFAWGFLAGFITASVVAAAAWLCLFGVVKKPMCQPDAIADDTTEVAEADSDSTTAVEMPQEQPGEKEADSENVGGRPEVEQTFKVTSTAYLSNISRKFYGHYAFWVYIYLDNKDIITDPDNLPVGAELRIPAPEKYGIDKDNPESVRRAEIKAFEIKNGK